MKFARQLSKKIPKKSLRKYKALGAKAGSVVLGAVALSYVVYILFQTFFLAKHL